MDWHFWKMRSRKLNRTPALIDGTFGYYIQNDGVQTRAGEEVTESRTLKLSVVWACISLRAKIISSMPCNLKNKDKTIDYDNPIHNLIHRRPNKYMTSADFWSAVSINLDLSGNAYIQVYKSVVDGTPLSLRLIPSDRVAVFNIDGKSLIYREYLQTKNDKEAYVDYGFDEIIHIKSFSRDGFLGLNPIEWQAETFGSLMAANKSADYTFANSLKAGGFIESADRIMQPEQREQLRRALTEFASPNNAGKFIVLEAGQKISSVKPVSSATDSQLLQSRYFGIEEICRVFGVPPALIGQTDKASSWASSLESLNQQFLTYSIDPILCKIEQALENKLLSSADGKFIKFNRSALLRTDAGTRASYYSQMVQNGIYTRNECRALEDMVASNENGADDLTIQLNMSTISNVAKGEDNAN